MLRPRVLTNTWSVAVNLFLKNRLHPVNKRFSCWPAKMATLNDPIVQALQEYTT
jgi:hypothetical protein